HYVPLVVYTAGAHTLTRQTVGTRYVAVAIRTLVDPNDPEDVKKVHALQDAIKVSQKGTGSSRFRTGTRRARRRCARRCSGWPPSSRISGAPSGRRARLIRCAAWPAPPPVGAATRTR